MKKVFTTLAILFLGFAVQAQTNMGINNANPDASAALDVTSTSQGMLVPRMTLAQRNMINMVSGVSTPATGLLIYQTNNTPGFYFYNGSIWMSLSGSGSSLPSQTGNAGKVLTTDGTNVNWTSAPILGNIQVGLCASGTSNSITVTDLNVRFILTDFQGGNPTATGTVVNLTLPSASSYPAGTSIILTLINMTVQNVLLPNTGFTLTSPGSTYTGRDANNVSTSTAYALPNNGANGRFNFVTDGISKWYRIN